MTEIRIAVLTEDPTEAADLVAGASSPDTVVVGCGRSASDADLDALLCDSRAEVLVLGAGHDAVGTAASIKRRHRCVRVVGAGRWQPSADVDAWAADASQVSNAVLTTCLF